MNSFQIAFGAAISRWIGRAIGLVLVTLLLIFAVGEGMPNPFSEPILVQVGFLALALILIGILAGWKWELSGGLISLFGWGLFVLVPGGYPLTQELELVHLHTGAAGNTLRGQRAFTTLPGKASVCRRETPINSERP